MARTWLMNGRGIAKKIKSGNHLSNYQIKELGIEAHRECPNCKHVIDNSDVSLEWPGLPSGVKFDPTDVELLEHLAAKVGLANSKAHMFIDEFIPTLEQDQGICYTHPVNLPGVKQDGSSAHFFHKVANAYATGHRKRRKIGKCSSMLEERVRWHKTGKTKPVIENGVQKGWKKIMVLYSLNSKKLDKANWVMHQYHLGIDEEEQDGEFVVSKVFLQQNAKQIDKGEAEHVNDNTNDLTVGTGPTTPKTVTPEPPRKAMFTPPSELHEYKTQAIFIQTEENPEVDLPPSVAKQNEDVGVSSLWLAGESQPDNFDPNTMEESLLCHEEFDSFIPVDEPSTHVAFSDFERGTYQILDRNLNTDTLFPELDDIPVDTPPDFQLMDLQLGSQDSISSWLDHF